MVRARPAIHGGSSGVWGLAFFGKVGEPGELVLEAKLVLVTIVGSFLLLSFIPRKTSSYCMILAFLKFEIEAMQTLTIFLPLWLILTLFWGCTGVSLKREHLRMFSIETFTASPGFVGGLKIKLRTSATSALTPS